MDSLIAEIFVFLKLNQSLDSATVLDEQKVIDKKADAAKPIYEKIEENFDKFEWNETYIQMVFNVCDIYETCCIMNYRLKCSEKIIGTMEKLAQVAKKLELE